MKAIVNFYVLPEDTEDSYEELVTGIETENPMYLTLQTGDTIISPKEESVEYVVTEIVKDFYREELDVYLSRVKSKGEILDEIGLIANKTIQSMLDSFKGVFTEMDKTFNNETSSQKDKNLNDSNVVFMNDINNQKKEEKDK